MSRLATLVAIGLALGLILVAAFVVRYRPLGECRIVTRGEGRMRVCYVFDRWTGEVLEEPVTRR